MAISDINKYLLKSVTSLNSNSSAREIINENFKKLQEVIVCIAELSVNDLNNLIFPNPPTLGTRYELYFDGTDYVLVEAYTNPGTRYVIPSDQNVIVKDGYQYLVHDHLFLNGTITLEGNAELIIL
jgi:hypothetical protein